MFFYVKLHGDFLYVSNDNSLPSYTLINRKYTSVKEIQTCCARFLFFPIASNKVKYQNLFKRNVTTT